MDALLKKNETPTDDSKKIVGATSLYAAIARCTVCDWWMDSQTEAQAAAIKHCQETHHRVTFESGYSYIMEIPWWKKKDEEHG
ncbi:MAG: hypothetical protein J4F41_00060 [Alphaproteobacteria bacterium]|nr:hypothetical protein [Alphaproteobacteria bacterium]